MRKIRDTDPFPTKGMVEVAFNSSSHTNVESIVISGPKSTYLVAQTVISSLTRVCERFDISPREFPARYAHGWSSIEQVHFANP